MDKEGVDFVEIGIPFSDPLADGPTIQQSSEVSLQNGMTLRLLLEQLKDIRLQVDEMPLLLMGYLNPILQYGMESFCQKISEIGIDGVIIPDLPLDEYLEKYQKLFQKYALANILLITPQTSAERIRMIDEHSDCFIYMVSSASVTGSQKGINTEKETYFKRIQNMKLKNPTMIGFGISDAESYQTACQYGKGAIIGSAFVQAIGDSENLAQSIHHFIQTIKK